MDKDLSKGRHNDVSKIAFQKSRPSHDLMRNKVFTLVDGVKCTQQIYDEIGKLPHELSGRFTELQRANKIYRVRKIVYKGSTCSVYAKVQ